MTECPVRPSFYKWIHIVHVCAEIDITAPRERAAASSLQPAASASHHRQTNNNNYTTQPANKMKWNETKSHLSSAQLARNLNGKIRNSTTVICLIHKRWYLAFIYSRLNLINFINYNPRMVYSAGRFLILVSCSCFFFFLCNYNVINYIMYI